MEVLGETQVVLGGLRPWWASLAKVRRRSCGVILPTPERRP